MRVYLFILAQDCELHSVGLRASGGVANVFHGLVKR